MSNEIKTVNSALANTIQSEVKLPPERQAGFNIFTMLARSGDVIAPWWSTTRDSQLRQLWKKSDHLSGAMYTTIAKISTIPMRIVPKDMSIKIHVKLAEDYTNLIHATAEFGEGWNKFYQMILEDLFGQDNGFFAEIIGDGAKDGPIIGMPISISHLDSARCLGRNTRVTLDSGRTMSILDVVESRYDGYVLSMSASGVIEPQKVNGWHATKLGNRYWIKITLKNSERTFGRPESVYFTNDHEIYTQSGWKKAEDLSYSDKIATRHFDFNDKQKSVLCGIMLGDGHLKRNESRYPNTSSISLCHGIKQKEWLLKKVDIFKPLRFSNLRYHSHLIRGKEFIDTIIDSVASPLLGEYRKLWYPDGIKIVPREFVEKSFSDELLACWYMDDGDLQKRNGSGRPSIRLSTHSFNKEDVQWLVQLLNKNNIECSIYSHKEGHDKNGNQKEYHTIYVTCDGTNNFLKSISRFVIPELRYKVPSGFDDYNSQNWNIGQGELFYSEIDNIDSNSSNGDQVTAFCIDVENNHNFIAGDMVVHNCTRTRNPQFPVIYNDIGGQSYKLHYSRVMYTSQMPSANALMNGVGFCAVSRSINTAQNLIDIGIYKQEKMGSRPQRELFITRGGLDPEDLATAIQTASSVMDMQGLTRFSKSVAVGDTNLPDADVKSIPLSGLPDGFDEKESTILGMSVLSMAFGIDARELFPGMDTGTKADAIIQHIKQRGKAVGQTIELIERQFDHKYLPTFLRMVFDYQDEAQDRDNADISSVRAQSRERDLKNRVSNARVERQKMVSHGEITQAQFEELELQDGRLDDGTDVDVLFHIPAYDEFLDGVTQTNYEDKIDDVMEFIGTSRDAEKIRMARQSVAAIHYKFEIPEMEAEMEAQLQAEGDGKNGDGKTSKVDTSYQQEKYGRKLPRTATKLPNEVQTYQGDANAT